MRLFDVYVAPAEFKFAGDGEPGVFEGYGSVFGNIDSHGDVILPGAFAASLAEHKAKGTMPGLYVEHSPYMGGDPLPVGVYTEMAEDDQGLRVKGKLSALDTDHTKRIRGLMQDGGLKGLSIAYTLPRGGVMLGKKPGDPKRTLKQINLRSVDIVRDPSNFAARVDQIKAGAGVDGGETNVDDAVEALATAIMMQDQLLQNGYCGPKDMALQMDALRDAYFALTGDRVPDGLVGWTKNTMTIREIERVLREECHLSHARARDVAARRFAELPRDEGSKKATAAGTKSALDDLGAAVSGFKLPTL